MEALKKFADFVNKIVAAFAIVLLVILIFACVLQVFFRVVLHNSLSWSEELARYMYVWVTWVGVSYSVRNGSHLRITMLRDRLPLKGRQGLEILVTIVWIAFGLFVMYMGIEAVTMIATYGQRSSALRIPMQFCYLSIPVGMGLMILRLIGSLIGQFKNFGKSEEGKAA